MVCIKCVVGNIFKSTCPNLLIVNRLGEVNLPRGELVGFSYFCSRGVFQFYITSFVFFNMYRWDQTCCKNERIVKLNMLDIYFVFQNMFCIDGLYNCMIIVLTELTSAPLSKQTCATNGKPLYRLKIFTWMNLFVSNMISNQCSVTHLVKRFKISDTQYFETRWHKPLFMTPWEVHLSKTVGDQ